MAMITKNRAGPIDKRVLLFSGGMDSVCYNQLLKPDVLLYIPTGAIYEKQEERCIYERLLPITTTSFIPLNHVLNLGRYERDDFIVPNRNAHLVLLASHYGDTIYLSSVEGDRSTDKDQKFYLSMTKLLNHMWDEQHWTTKRDFNVVAPFKDYTKTTLVRMYLSSGGNPELLFKSYSCYGGKEQHCGVCKPCFRKRVALEKNNLTIPDNYFAEPFWEASWFIELYPTIKKGEYRGLEDRDVLCFLAKHGL